MTMKDGMQVFDLRIVRAIEEPEMAQEFYEGHVELINQLNIEGLTSVDFSWRANPNVLILCLYQGENMIGGTRLHFYHRSFDFPMEAPVFDKDEELRALLSTTTNQYHGEWCGLWVSKKAKGYGLGRFLTNAAISSAKSAGLDYIYGICPRHTLDDFRSIGFHFWTYHDRIVQFEYPPGFQSYVIQCETQRLEYCFKPTRQAIEEMLAEPNSMIPCKGKIEDCLVRLNGWPSKDLDLLDYRAWDEQKDLKEIKLHSFDKIKVQRD